MNWVYITAAIVTIVFIVGVLPSCTVVKSNYSAKKARSGAVYYYLPESLLKIKATVKIQVIYDLDKKTFFSGFKPVQQTFQVTSVIIPDTREMLTLNYKPNALMADEIKFKVNSKGLLESIDITTEDRTAQIIEKLAQAPQVILGQSAIAPKAANLKSTFQEFSADFEIRAAQIGKSVLVPWNVVIINEFDPTNQDICDVGFNIESNIVAGTSVAIKTQLENDKLVKPNEVEISGILTRPLSNIELQFIPKNITASSLPTNTVIVDRDKILNVPIKRTAFVKRQDKVSVLDGVITSNELSKPSSVEGFISIPINIAKAIVQIPGQLITFRYDNITKETNLEKAKLAQEQAVMDYQKYVLQKDMEMDKIKVELEKYRNFKELEMLKYKSGLDKLLLDAQKAQIDAQVLLIQSQKTLDDLRKQIEAQKSN